MGRSQETFNKKEKEKKRLKKREEKQKKKEGGRQWQQLMCTDKHDAGVHILSWLLL